MHTERALICVSIWIALALAGCTGQESSSERAIVQAPQAAAPIAQEAAATQAPAPGQTAFWSAQKLIRTAEMVLEVEDVERVTGEIEAMATRLWDGFLAGSESSVDRDGTRRSFVTVRIPTAHFQNAILHFRGLGNVDREKLHTEDVTKAYADLETRLEVKRETESRLRALLSSRAGDLSEVLQVERELGRVVGEIEQMEGERRFYDNRIAISTIRLELYEPRAAVPQSVFAPVGEALGSSLSVLASSVSALIYLVVFLLPWCLVGIPVWWGVRALRRRRVAEAEASSE